MPENPVNAWKRRPFAKMRVCTTKFDFESRKIDFYILGENKNTVAQFGCAYCTHSYLK